jgi:Winged helix DNA-binding domain
MRRQLLHPVGDPSVADVVARLCGVQAQVASSAELAVGVRRRTSRRGEVERALRDGRLIKTWAMRGTLHLLTPGEAGAFLSLLASGRSWERPSWQRYFGVTPRQVEALRRAAGVVLADGPLTREELVDALTARRGLKHVGDALRSGWGTLLKPLAWQGALCFGPSRGNRVTFHAARGRELALARPPRGGRCGADRHGRIRARLRADDGRRVRDVARRWVVR